MLTGGPVTVRAREYGARARHEQASVDPAAAFDRASWRAVAALGVHGALTPAEYGGAPAAIEDYAGAMIELGRSRLPLGMLFSLGAHVLACTTVLAKYGTPAQRQRWLPGMSKGSRVAAIAVAERAGSSDAFSMQTRARPDGRGGYTLHGTKSYITNATVCDVALVFAQEETTGRVVCALVPRATDGFETAPVATAGLAGGDMGEIALHGCRVDPEDVLGTGTRAKLIFMHAMEWERGLILAPALGVMEAQIAECLAWLRNRRQHDRRLSDLQAVRHRLAGMQRRLYLSQLALADFVRRKHEKRRAFREASLIKWTVAEAFLKNSLDAMSLYGAYGYTAEAQAQRDVCDALAFQAASGTADIQKNIVAESLALAGGAHAAPLPRAGSPTALGATAHGYGGP